MKITPDFNDFRTLSRQGNTVAVYAEIAADLDTPVSAFLKLQSEGQGFLLESVEGGERWARYSVLGTAPLMTLRAEQGTLTVWHRDGGTVHYPGEPLDTLAQVLAPFRPAPQPELERFGGGFVGYLSYDLVRWFERLPEHARDELSAADVSGMIADSFVLFDNVSHTMKVVALAFVPGSEADAAARQASGADSGTDAGPGAEPDAAADAGAGNVAAEASEAAPTAESLRAAYDDAVRRVRRDAGILRTATVQLPEPRPASPEPKPALGEGVYEAAVERAREYIRAGDIIQVVLSQRFSQPLQSHPFSLYRALRTINPSPYMFYLDLGDEIVLGASPEMMVEVTNGVGAGESTPGCASGPDAGEFRREVSVRPIAGTIRRGATPAEDAALIEKMLADPKEQAEHIMLLDLGRNDVGRVADIGSVRVRETMKVERYSHVNHIVSHVSGTLRRDADRMDAFRAAFPAGTLSGAPKVRAMEIIEELEPARRGVYGGAVGYVDFTGGLDTCIAIRTMFIKDDTVYVQSGAGVVADSNPERENAECREKARAMMVALERAREMEVG